ncbi:hypothetical protein IQ10_01423 [Halalkalibacter nanhaiisediminis]|uniref:Uncharacterized protein n=1 Tax=Halalkalibacter nanhaiisediminis TaxID=688079 RepID=A0A562QMW4_9BACI|nr:hypothetical protein IQ10_01423 [Halalkalibacter nanhaiisediminis]
MSVCRYKSEYSLFAVSRDDAANAIWAVDQYTKAYKTRIEWE